MEGCFADENTIFLKVASQALLKTCPEEPSQLKDRMRVDCTIGSRCVEPWTAWMFSLRPLALPASLTLSRQPFFCCVDTWVAVDNLVLLSLLVILESRAGGNHDPLQMCPETQCRAESTNRPAELPEQRSFCRGNGRIWTSF